MPIGAEVSPAFLYLQWDFVRQEKQMGQLSGDPPFYLSGTAQARL